MEITLERLARQIRDFWRDQPLLRDIALPETLIRLMSEKYGLPDYRLYPERTTGRRDEIMTELARAAEGYPLAYLMGKTSFYREEYFVSEGVLIPRADTEILVEYAIGHIGEKTCFADLCCGSGCIGISVLKSRPDLSCVAADLSPEAVRLSEKNAVHNGVARRFSVRQCDIFSERQRELLTGCGALLCNPPYLRTEEMETLPANVKREPPSALNGGEDGLAFYRRLKTLLFSLPSLTLAVFEIGFAQKEQVLSLFDPYRAEVLRDYHGHNRVVVINTQTKD